MLGLEVASRRTAARQRLGDDGTGAVDTAMPKLSITYQLPDEQAEFDAARLGRSALSVLWHIDQHCRSIVKHGEPTEEERRLAEDIRAMIPGECLEV